MSIINYKTFIKVFCLLALPAIVYAQQNTDTLSSMRAYLTASNAYKRLPMHASIELKNTSTFISSPEDTGTIVGEFYLTNKEAYIKFGEMEQIVTDSLLLMVSSNAQRMILMPNNRSLSSMTDVMGVKQEDSSLVKMAKKYVATILPVQHGIASIEVRSRATLYNTTEPKGLILFRYKEKTGMPIDLVETKRMIIALDSSQYNQFSKDPAYKNSAFLFQQNGGYYLIKEQVSVCVYKKIEYDDEVHVPVSITDRIVKKSNGDYIPVKGYQSYQLDK